MSTQRILFAGDSVMYSTGLAYVILSLMKQFHKRGGYELEKCCKYKRSVG